MNRNSGNSLSKKRTRKLFGVAAAAGTAAPEAAGSTCSAPVVASSGGSEATSGRCSVDGGGALFLLAPDALRSGMRCRQPQPMPQPRLYKTEREIGHLDGRYRKDVERDGRVPALASPIRVGCDGDLAARIAVRVVHVELQLAALVRLDQREQVLALVQHRVGADDVVRVRLQAGQAGGRVRVHILGENNKTQVESALSIANIHEEQRRKTKGSFTIIGIIFSSFKKKTGDEISKCCLQAKWNLTYAI